MDNQPAIPFSVHPSASLEHVKPDEVVKYHRYTPLSGSIICTDCDLVAKDNVEKTKIVQAVTALL